MKHSVMYYYDIYNNYDSRVWTMKMLGFVVLKEITTMLLETRRSFWFLSASKPPRKWERKKGLYVCGGDQIMHMLFVVHACFETAKVTVMGREGIFKTSLLFPFCLCNKHACGLYLLFECHLATHLLLHSLQYIPWGLVDALCLITVSSFWHRR